MHERTSLLYCGTKRNRSGASLSISFRLVHSSSRLLLALLAFSSFFTRVVELLAFFMLSRLLWPLDSLRRNPLIPNLPRLGFDGTVHTMSLVLFLVLIQLQLSASIATNEVKGAPENLQIMAISASNEVSALGS